MSTYPQLQAQFAQAMTSSLDNSAALALTDDPVLTQVTALVNALPYYGDMTIEQVHRSALATLLEVNMPNPGIAPHPSDSGFGYYTSYSYNGNFSGYQNAFYSGVALSATANAVATQVQAASGNLNNQWWGNFGVTVLTDAVRLAVSPSLDTGKLSTDLSSDNAALLPALSASYLGVFSTGFSPTAAVVSAVLGAGQGSAAVSLLSDAAVKGQFTSNINQAVAMGGDSTNAAVWFLFNLWISLKALGAPNVDDIIQRSAAGGLTVPAQVGPGVWWSGGYTSWFAALSGSDVSAQAAGTIAADLPETEMTAVASDPPVVPIPFSTSEPHGYATSLCNWGALNWYNPPPSSCFGRGTLVLMADGAAQAIETLAIGDEVLSSQGPRRVVLVESPLRQGRALYQLNGLEVFVTSAHPFRCAISGAGLAPALAAVDPWALMDSLPDRIRDGVTALRPGSRLQGWQQGETEVEVTQLTALQGDDAEERVYDLLLERWTEDKPAYYVGGPDTFLAAESETADPSFDLACTVAVASALQGMIGSTHAEVATVRQVAEALSQLRLPPSEDASAVLAVPATLPAVPDVNFYLREGRWDEQASMLEAQLIRQHARTIRRRLSRPALTGSGRSDTSAGLIVRDLELLGDSGLPPQVNSTLEFRLRGAGLQSRQEGDRVFALPLGQGEKTRWLLLLDQLIDFKVAGGSGGPAALVGTLSAETLVIGHFRFNLELQATQGVQEHFLFSPEGVIVGRLAVEEVTLHPSGPEVSSAEAPGVGQQMARAVQTGEHLAEQFRQVGAHRLARTRVSGN
ncbi:hypothetical protein GO986_02545 [Deinococcus sp. HMF7620]|uniref:Hom-end-associated Hint domain-containing protein n=1 Tax=Deinococcus arboris TaxID=2682977 RepID=A0A7C9LK87_9DEIO|nr:Hint domain-containing homing endonuclease [Deinococcus arboris]MVN85637.1 hypothetical protein [Deinococcus arboris]